MLKNFEKYLFLSKHSEFISLYYQLCICFKVLIFSEETAMACRRGKVGDYNSNKLLQIQDKATTNYIATS